MVSLAIVRVSSDLGVRVSTKYPDCVHGLHVQPGVRIPQPVVTAAAAVLPFRLGCSSSGGWPKLFVADWSHLIPVFIFSHSRGRAGYVIIPHYVFIFCKKKKKKKSCSSHIINSMIVSCEIRLTDNIPPEPNLCMESLKSWIKAYVHRNRFCAASESLESTPWWVCIAWRCCCWILVILQPLTRITYVAALVLSGTLASLRGLNRWEYKWLLARFSSWPIDGGVIIFAFFCVAFFGLNDASNWSGPCA